MREVELRMLFSSAPYGGEEFNPLLAASPDKLLKFPLGRKLNESWSRSGPSGEHGGFHPAGIRNTAVAPWVVTAPTEVARLNHIRFRCIA